MDANGVKRQREGRYEERDAGNQQHIGQLQFPHVFCAGAAKSARAREYEISLSTSACHVRPADRACAHGHRPSGRIFRELLHDAVLGDTRTAPKAQSTESLIIPPRCRLTLSPTATTRTRYAYAHASRHAVLWRKPPDTRRLDTWHFIKYKHDRRGRQCS